MGVFRAESSDLSHMGLYTGMDVISVWALLRANTVCYESQPKIVCGKNVQFVVGYHILLVLVCTKFL